ncbi:27740_t:CDS:2 [Racocetra persica]|uniref:27740_t:CDS:1 n=1 Tax=Racocetra persica TaxID=160502 RepID=A0ACA9LT37_9GLOM|nr:27740_t:CDS:2 [Racocetra persica]
MDTLFATLNLFRGNGKMYCGTMQWQHNRPQSFLRVAIHSVCGDQTVFEITRHPGDIDPKDLENSRVIPHSADDWTITVPTVVGYHCRHPIIEYQQRYLRPNRLAMHRVSNYLWKNHRDQADIIEFATDKLLEINNTIIMEDSKKSSKIDLNIDLIVLHAILLEHLHRNRRIEYRRAITPSDAQNMVSQANFKL